MALPSLAITSCGTAWRLLPNPAHFGISAAFLDPLAAVSSFVLAVIAGRQSATEAVHTTFASEGSVCPCL
jgi:hypothetical protein